MKMLKLKDVIDKDLYYSDEEYQEQLLDYLYTNKVRLVGWYGKDSDTNNKYVQLDEFVKEYSINIYNRWTRNRDSFYRLFKDVHGYTVSRYRWNGSEYHSYWLVEKRNT